MEKKVKNYKSGSEAVLSEFVARAKFKAALFTKGFEPNENTQKSVDDLSNECSDKDYKRVELQNVKVVDKDGATVVSCDPISFGDKVSLTASHFVVYADNMTGKPLVAYGSFGGEKSSENSEFVVTLTSGFFGVK